MGAVSDAEDWLIRLGTPWGRLQAVLLRRRLLAWIGDRPSGSVLDIGCGAGDLTAALLPKATEVTCVDRSEAMLSETQARLSGLEVPVRFVQRDLGDGLDGLGSYGLVVAHNVIDYAAHPREAIRAVVRCVADGGLLSVSFGNGASVALRHAVMTHDLDEALRLARIAEIGRLPGPCGASMRLRRSLVEEWLHEAGVEVTHRAGVRVLNDLLPDEIKSDDNLSMIEELEYELGARLEMVDLGAIVHLAGQRAIVQPE